MAEKDCLGTWPAFLAKPSMTAAADSITPSTRWLQFPGILMVQIPTGAIYAWSFIIFFRDEAKT